MAWASRELQRNRGNYMSDAGFSPPSHGPSPVVGHGLTPEQRALASSPTIENRLMFDGNNADLWPMTLRIAILNLITLFFYRFWGRTKVRQYLWARTSFLGNRLTYTGTGKELFIGFLIVFFLILGPIFGISAYIGYAFSTDLVVQMIFGYSIFIVSYFLFYVATYRALRYRLSRTNWRGIRGTQSGSAFVYALKAFGWLLLMPFTAGLLYPVQSVSLTSMKLNNAWFGNRKFSFDGTGRSGLLYKPFIRAWLGFIFKPIIIMVPLVVWFTTLGTLEKSAGGNVNVNDMILGQIFIYTVVGIFLLRTYARYKARELAIMAPWIKFGNLRFSFEATHNEMFNLIFINILITLLSLGLAKPFAQKRMVKFICDHVTVIGAPDLDSLGQSKDKGPGMGEGLADAFDAGSI
jgi:uncharacterized membrane protein YjgN (DUF898 family)